MSPIRKYGIIGAVLVLVAAFGGSLFANSTGAAPLTPVTLSSATGVPNAGAGAAATGTIVSVSYLDDTPASTGSLNFAGAAAGQVGYWDALGSPTGPAGGCEATSVDADVTRFAAAAPTTAATAAQTGACAVSDDVDTAAEGVTLSGEFICVTAGTFTFTFTEGGITTAGVTLTCTALTVTPTFTPTVTSTVPATATSTSTATATATTTATATATVDVARIPAVITSRVAIGGSTPDCGAVTGFGFGSFGTFGTFTGFGFGGAQATLCVTNRTNVEIIPAPGSDNDARIDVRITNAAGSAISGIRVHFITTNGSITVGNGTGVPGIASDESVIEPAIITTTASGALGLTSVGDTCDGAFTTTLVGISSGAAPNAFLPQSADALTNSSGIVSACYFASFPGAPTAVPGPALVTILADINTVTSVIGTVSIQVVGPPASLTISASPTTLRCGEKATITVTVKDSIGQNVSDHSLVDLVTNFGGVIAGGSPFLGGSLVSPLSSGAAETFAGVATAFLLTSETHSGPYEVVATAGGSFAGGIFSTPPISGQVTINCTQVVAVPTAAATVRAPSTGDGITPPSTGDAGLASSASSSLSLIAVAGMVALALAGVMTLKVNRR